MQEVLETNIQILDAKRGSRRVLIFFFNKIINLDVKIYINREAGTTSRSSIDGK